MKGLLLGLLFATSNSPTDLSVASRAIEWKLNGDLIAHCVLATWGDVQSASGAQVNVQCDSEENVAGNLVLKLPASRFQNRRVTLIMDVEQGQQMTSTLWVKSSRENRTQLLNPMQMMHCSAQVLLQHNDLLLLSLVMLMQSV